MALTGYGTSEYGLDQYGFGDVGPTPSAVLIQPSLATSGDSILVASAGGDLVNNSRDDKFTGSTISGVWDVLQSGAVNTAPSSQGLTVELTQIIGGGIFQLLGAATFVSGDIIFDYQILSNFLSDNPTNELVYAGLEMATPNTKLSVVRRLFPGVNGHQGSAIYTVNDVFSGAGHIITTAAKGRLRLIKHGSSIAALHDDVLLLRTNLHSGNDFTVKLFTTNNAQSQYIKTKYVCFRSNTGIILGNALVLNKTLETDERILGTVPPSDQVGLVNVAVFNHFGVVGSGTNAFEYQLTLRQSLSRNGGIMGNIQSDASIRD